jgi:hypothetical protein
MKQWIVWVSVVHFFAEMLFLFVKLLEFVVPKVIFDVLLVVDFPDGC